MVSCKCDFKWKNLDRRGRSGPFYFKTGAGDRDSCRKMEPLHEAIQSLYKVEEDKVEQALRVIIVSSLAGGTGSGLILPVALYTKNYLATHFRLSAYITRGFFILQEVF